MGAFVRAGVDFGDNQDIEQVWEVVVQQGEGIRLDYKAAFADNRSTCVSGKAV